MLRSRAATAAAAASAQAAQLGAPADIYAAGLVDIPDVFDVTVIAHSERPQDVSAALALAAAVDRGAVLLAHDAQLADGAETLLLEHQPPHIVIIDSTEAAGSDSSDGADTDAQHSGLEMKGALECWGNRSGGGTGAGAGSGLPDEYSARRYVSVSAGSGVTCALRPAQLIDCWDINRGDAGSSERSNAAIEHVPGGLYSAVSAGGSFACALRTNTSVVCWGREPGDAWEPFGGDVDGTAE